MSASIATLPLHYWDNGKENGNYHSILGLYWDNGNEHGIYYSILGISWDNGKENGNYYRILGLYHSRPALGTPYPESAPISWELTRSLRQDAVTPRPALAERVVKLSFSAEHAARQKPD